MKKLFCLLVMICAYSATYAQTLTVKSVNLRPQDARAASQSREDKSGKKCAIIRVGVVGVDDLVFPAAVGNVERALSEYVVYVPDGLKTLQYENKSGKRLGTIVFDDYDLEINSLKSYDVIFESENHLRSAIFSVQPQNAQLQFNGEKVEIDADGMAMINAPVGEYPYQVSANGFETQSGTVTLAEDEISTVTDVVLQEILYPVTINVSPEDATVFIDNVPYAKENRNDLQLSGGKHSVRVTAANYVDEEQTIDVNENLLPVKFVLKENKQEVIVHKGERTRTKVNIRNANYLSFVIEGLASKLNSEMYLVGPKIGYDYVRHFGGLFAMRDGFGASLLFPVYNGDFEGKKKLQDSIYHISVDVPIQIGISIPYGKYNQHLFSVFAGGYGRASFLINGRTEAKKHREELSDEHFELGSFYDFGLRASAKLDRKSLSIGVDVSQSLNGYGLSCAIMVGLKWY